MGGKMRLLQLTREFKDSHYCKLEQGDIVPYDMMCSEEHFEGYKNNPDWVFLGKGVVYSIYGTLQSGEIEYCFFRELENE